MYVIADDEHHLGVFSTGDHRKAGRLLRLRRGTLPLDTSARKRRKPDFEALVALPPFGAYPNGALFALGSGSKPNPVDSSSSIGTAFAPVNLIIDS